MWDSLRGELGLGRAESLFSQGNSKDSLQPGESGYLSDNLALSFTNVILPITSKHSWALCHCMDLLNVRNLHVLTPTAVAESVFYVHHITSSFWGQRKTAFSLYLGWNWVLVNRNVSGYNVSLPTWDSKGWIWVPHTLFYLSIGWM